VVALGEGVLQQQHDAGAEVAEDVLEGEPESDRGQPQAADQDPGVDAPDRQGDEQPDRGHGVEGQGGHDHHDVAFGVGAAQRPLNSPAHRPGHRDGEHDGEQRAQELGQLVDERVGELTERFGQALQRLGSS
jgi:hypothetical protein